MHLRRLRRTTAHLERIVDAVPAMLAYWNADEECEFANLAYERWFGVKLDAMLGMKLRDLLGPLYALNRPYIEGALRGEPQAFEREIPDPVGGPSRYSHAEYIPHVVGGRVEGFSVMVTDISARKRLEDRLRESEARLRAVLGAMAEGVVVQTRSGEIVTSNPAAEALLGLTHDQLIGRSSLDPRWRAVHEDGSPFPGETHPAMETLRTGKAHTGVIMGVHKPSGEKSWLSVSSQPFGDTDASLPPGVVCTFRDVTQDRLAAERTARLARQERLVTTGKMAAGVAHEINNPLMYVLANLDFAIEELHAMAQESPTDRFLELIRTLTDARTGAVRIRDIVRGLRALASQDSPPVATQVRPCIETSVNMAMHELRRRATVVVELPEVPAVLADESRLTQVLVNLLVNAAQAFSTDDPARNRVVVSASTIDDHVRITVEDNGPGIPADVLPRIFDPFFTTKPVGHGTGLGLSISQSIVSALGGELRCESVVGRGTEFHVQLPAVELPGKNASDPPDAESPTRGRVLIVDDDVAVLNSLERIVSSEHDVVAASDPRDALDRITKGEHFDVILCDLMMPYLSGLELHQRTKELQPDLVSRFVFMTGGVLDESMNGRLSHISNPVLEKPVGLATLRKTIGRFLRRTDDRGV
ncbi:MAG TPA: ATP-binding protein [Polyangiaceae bacterium]|nr:ATP-binding protein [Polyangiaceae bacterium]